MAELLDAKAIKTNDKYTLYAKIAANEAMLDSKLDKDNLDKSRFGCIISSGIGGLSTIAENKIQQELADQIAEQIALDVLTKLSRPERKLEF